MLTFLAACSAGPVEAPSVARWARVGDPPFSEPVPPTASDADEDSLPAFLSNALVLADVNGVGFDDVIAGAPKAKVLGDDSGAVYVYPGGPDGVDPALEPEG